MSFLDDETFSQPIPQRVWSAKIATNPIDVSDRVSVTIPALDPSLRWDDCRWQSRDDVSLPQRGDDCVVVLDESNAVWVIGWWPFGS